MRKFVDTNIFLRFVDGDEVVVDFWNKLINEKQTYWVQAIVISELVWVLGSLYKYDRQKISDFLMAVLKTNNLLWTGDCDLIKAMGWYQQGRAKYNDCLIVSCMKEGDQIVSFDREFDKFEWIKRVGL